MVPFLAVGGSQWPPRGEFDFLPLVGVLLAILMTRFVLSLAMTTVTTTLAIAAGTGWAWATEGWGWPVPTMAGLVLLIVVAVLTPQPGHLRRHGGLG